ncbi:MAG: FAD-dependent oxidoreductase [Proteobacteria bacterium]|nr:FAD-dependent oxidoreductase [Pseudomonadota bacterium]
MAALAAKRTQSDRRVLLLGEEDRDPYEKPPLSKSVLAGLTEPETQLIVKPGMLAAAGVEVAQGAMAVAIDRARRLVHLRNGPPVSYGALVLATGAKARALAALPAGAPNVCYLRTAADALALRTALRGASGRRPVVVVGGGLIGLEAAASIGRASTTVLEAGSSALSRVCSADFAQVVVDRHRSAGVSIRLGVAIASASPSRDGIIVQLDDGTVIEAALLIVGVGGEPNTDLAIAAGLPVDDGILVDEHCRTSDPSIFAAGDVARFRTRWCRTPARLENWRHALDHGEAAGVNAAGGDTAYDCVPSFWSDQYDLRIQAVGWTDGLASPPLRRSVGDDRLIEFHVRDGRVRYAIAVGMGREMGIVRRMIERGTTVTAQVLTDPSVSLQALLGS